MSKPAYYLVNGITVYRMLAVFVLILLIMQHHWHVFRWLLLLSFLTDAIDGFLARRYGVISKAGAVLDSIGVNLTLAVATPFPYTSLFLVGQAQRALDA